MEALGVPVLPIVGATGGWTLAFWFVWLFYTGKIVTSAQHLRELARADSVTESERAEKNMWRETAQTSSRQAEQMLDGLETVEQLLHGLMQQKDQP